VIRLSCWLWLGVLAACGGASAEAPLSVPIGTNRDQLARELRDHQYCTGKEFVAADATTETFPLCDAPGLELSQSWVVAHFDGGRVIKVQRWERHDEESRGVERFNQLVEKRAAAHGNPSEDAKAALAAQQDLPAGTRTWVAFAQGDDALVAVYLLTPRPPENATVLEEVIARER
jgi:hypothetical protein